MADDLFHDPASTVERRTVLAGGLSVVLTAGLAGGAAAQPVIRPFRLEVPDAKLQSILARVRGATWPRLAVGTGWSYGVEAGWFRDLVAYWGDGYDWRRQEAAINRQPQFMTELAGRQAGLAHRRSAQGEAPTALHFVHRRSARADAPAVLLLHGWPYSVHSFSEVIEPLARDFHVIAPSLPGSFVSQAPDDRPRGLRFISERLHALMTERLGYPRYFVQGADHGGVVADWLALDRPEAVLGEQTNQIAFRHKGAEYASGETGLGDAAPEEHRFVEQELEVFKRESGYFELQRTRPETLAYAMADSPVGLAAYVLDKWARWTDTRARSLEEVV